MAFKFDLVANFSAFYMMLFMILILVATSGAEAAMRRIMSFMETYDKTHGTPYAHFVRLIEKELWILGFLGFIVTAIDANVGNLIDERVFKVLVLYVLRFVDEIHMLLGSGVFSLSHFYLRSFGHFHPWSHGR